MEIMTLLFYITQFGVLLLALSIHEAAHAFAANKFGDPTAKMLGRLTLNPKAHVDPIGTLLMPLIAIVTHFPVIGWAKPVPVNPYNLRDPKLDHAFIAGAGPVSNLLQTLIYTVILWVMNPFAESVIMPLYQNSQLSPLNWLQVFLYMICFAGILVNLVLAVFNLIPIPPLDGGWIIGGVLPDRFAAALTALGSMGFIIIMILLYTGFFGYVLVPIYQTYLTSFVPENSLYVLNYIFR